MKRTTTNNQNFKIEAKDKITNKITRNGLAEKNKNTGEAKIISQKEQDIAFNQVKTTPLENNKIENFSNTTKVNYKTSIPQNEKVTKSEKLNTDTILNKLENIEIEQKSDKLNISTMIDEVENTNILPEKQDFSELHTNYQSQQINEETKSVNSDNKNYSIQQNKKIEYELLEQNIPNNHYLDNKTSFSKCQSEPTNNKVDFKENFNNPVY